MYKTISVSHTVDNVDTPEHIAFVQLCWNEIDTLVTAGKTDGQKVTDINEEAQTVTVTRTWVDQAAAQEWGTWLEANTPAEFTAISFDIQPV